MPPPTRGDRPRSRRPRRPARASCASSGRPAAWASRARAGSAGDGLVVTNAHVVAGEDDTVVQRARRRAAAGGARRSASTPRNDVAVLRVAGSARAGADAGGRRRRSGAEAAILGFPRNGPYDVRAARLGRRARCSSEDAYGHGPVTRSMTPFRGLGAPGQLGRSARRRGGRVLATVFAATRERRRRGGYGVPNAVVARALPAAPRRPSTGPCAAARPCRHAAGCTAGRYAPRHMGKTLVIAEKPSVGTRPRAGAARALREEAAAGRRPSAGSRAPSTSSRWAVGHLVQLAEPDEYDDKFKKWRMADLPIVPDRVQARRARRALAEADGGRQARCSSRDDVDLVINACDAGREGELIFAYLFEKAGAKKPVKRLWLYSMTNDAMRERFAHLRDGEELPSSRRPPARARRPTGSSA